MKQTEEVFTPELIRKWEGVGEPTSVPVFIIGMMRSGSTLVEQILASHPEVFGGGELKLLAKLWRAYLPSRVGASRFRRSRRAQRSRFIKSQASLFAPDGLELGIQQGVTLPLVRIRRRLGLHLHCRVSRE
jgi:hypothetical protein